MSIALENTEKIIDLDRAVGLSDASHLMRGRGGRSPSVETVRRWANAKKGCHPQGTSGPQLVLRTVRLNGELLTTPEWVEAFERERLRLGARLPDNAVLPRSKRTREASMKRAAAHLDREGVGKSRDKEGAA